MNIPIPGAVRITFNVDSVTADPIQFPLSDEVTDFSVAFSMPLSNARGTVMGTYRDEITVTKAQIEADAGKPFESCTPRNLRRAIQRTVVAHVKATL